MMQKEPLAITTLIRVAMYQLVVGLEVFNIVEFDDDQFGYLVGGFVILIEAIMWLITRNEVWAPAGAPTHPPTEALWSTKVAAVEAEKAHAIAELKTDYEGRLAATAIAVDGEFATPPTGGRHVAPLDMTVHEAQVDTVNPGQET